MIVQQVTKTMADKLFFVFNMIQVVMMVSKIMDLAIYAFQIMTHVLTVIKMTGEEMFYAFNFLINVLQALKIMDLETFVFLGRINVQMGTKMMDEEQSNAFLWIKIAPQDTSMMVVAQFASP